MKLHKVTSALLRDGFLIDQEAAASYAPVILAILEGKFDLAASLMATTAAEGGARPARKKPTTHAEAVDEYEEATPGRYIVATAARAGGGVKLSRYNSMDRAPAGSVAVIVIDDVVMKADAECGPLGTRSLAGLVSEAAAHPNIAGILLQIDSPGGQVSGTATLADAIKDARQVKPVVGLVDDGMMASAAYWFGSACQELYASQVTDQVGSIGVYTTLIDFSKRYEALGLKVHEIYAPQSTEKNAEYKQALTGNYKAVQERLRQIADQFISQVKANRPQVDESAFKGGLYNATEAKKKGLIDGFLSYSAAIQRVKALATEPAGAPAPAPTPSATTTAPTSGTADPVFPTTQTHANVNRPLLTALLAVAALSVTANGTLELSAEQLDKIEGALKDGADQAAAVEKAVTDLKNAQAAEKAAGEKATELQGKLDTANGVIAAYGKKPGADDAKPTAGADPTNPTDAAYEQLMRAGQPGDSLLYGG